MAGKILQNLSNKHGRKSLVIMLAKLAKCTGGSNDDERIYLTIEDAFIEHPAVPAAKLSSPCWFSEGLAELL
ncbi:hypothetical protein GGQ98_003614 [Sphingosinicella soli]|uniref:Uncharacterized protein n=1 Tax=Sphingosinicella soli TaxID=333708 RepID=A0A7W7B4Q5_9SPHN|nr:hypothetical protein [Sphingosinicella soli]